MYHQQNLFHGASFRDQSRSSREAGTKFQFTPPFCSQHPKWPLDRICVTENCKNNFYPLCQMCERLITTKNMSHNIQLIERIIYDFMEEREKIQTIQDDQKIAHYFEEICNYFDQMSEKIEELKNNVAKIFLEYTEIQKSQFQQKLNLIEKIINFSSEADFIQSTINLKDLENFDSQRSQFKFYDQIQVEKCSIDMNDQYSRLQLEKLDFLQEFSQISEHVNIFLVSLNDLGKCMQDFPQQSTFELLQNSKEKKKIAQFLIIMIISEPFLTTELKDCTIDLEDFHETKLQSKI